MKNKFVLSIFVIFMFFSSLGKAYASGEVVLHLFWAEGCPHCASEKDFLESIRDEYPDLLINEYEITHSSENLELLKKVGKELSADISGVPFTVIGDKFFIGYYSDEISGSKIRQEIEKAIKEGCNDVVGCMPDGDGKLSESTVENKQEISLNVPLVGKLDLKKLSLPVVTVAVALLDGFNPCAMWTLLFLISLLLGMKDRKRMWILGVTFIISSAFVYFLFMTAWMNLFLFLGLVVWVRLIIAAVALGSGGYYLRDYFVNKQGGCEVMGNEKRQKTFEKIKGITQKKNFFLAMAGIIMLAFAVNLVELICSAGLPAIYTNVLSLAKLPVWQYYLYLGLYIFIFMLDDLIIFVTAMITLQAVGIQSKYSRLSHLIGGLLMLVIGMLLIFKPEWLMFG